MNYKNTGNLKKNLASLALVLFLVSPLVTSIPLNSNSERGNWKMFQSNLNHTGFTNNSGPKNLSSVTVRNFTTSEAGVQMSSSPAVANGYVYIGSSDSHLYQLNASNVTQHIANYTTPSSFPVDTSPAVEDGYVYVGGNGGSVYQLNASNVTQKIANYTADGSIDGSPAVANGYVYVGSYDENLYQLNASNVTQKIANYSTKGILKSSPAVANGYVYVGSNDESIYQLNASNVTQKIANFSTGDIVQSSPTVRNGYVYVGSDNGLYQLNASNVTQKIADYRPGGTGNEIRSSPAVANGYVYIGTANTYLYKLNASNISQQIGNYSTGANILSSPAVANGSVYFGGDDGNLTQLNASNISQKIANYSTRLGVFEIRSSPAIAGGALYVGDEDNVLYQFGNFTEFIKPPTVTLELPANSTSQNTPVNFTFTPHCFSESCSGATVFLNQSGWTPWKKNKTKIQNGTTNWINFNLSRNFTLPKTFKWNIRINQSDSQTGLAKNNLTIQVTPPDKFNRNITDSLDLGIDKNRLSIGIRSTTQTLKISNTPDPTSRALRLLYTPLSTTETNSATTLTRIIISQIIETSETVNLASNILRIFSTPLAVADTKYRQEIINRISSQTLGYTTNTINTITLQKTISTTIKLSSTAIKSTTISRTATQVLDIASTLSRNLISKRKISETYTTNTNTQGTYIVTRTLSLGLDLSSTLTRTTSITRNFQTIFNISTFLEFITPTEDNTDSNGGSSGGGGGSGGSSISVHTTDNNQKNNKTKKQTTPYGKNLTETQTIDLTQQETTQETENITLNFKKEKNHSINKLKFNCQKSIKNLSISITKLSTKPPSLKPITDTTTNKLCAQTGKITITKREPSEVYRYLKIEHKNFNKCGSKQVEVELSIFKNKFKNLQKRKGQTINISQPSTTLRRFNRTKWNTYPTKISTDTKKYLNYTTKLPSLSYLAVALKLPKTREKSLAEEKDESTGIKKTANGCKYIEKNKKKVKQRGTSRAGNVEDPTSDRRIGSLISIATLILLIAIVTALFFYRRSGKTKNTGSGYQAPDNKSGVKEKNAEPTQNTESKRISKSKVLLKEIKEYINKIKNSLKD